MDGDALKVDALHYVTPSGVYFRIVQITSFS